MFINGFKFGMLLQLAIGPICLFVFQAAATLGVWAGLVAVASIVLVDAGFIVLSVFGIGALLQRPTVNWALRFWGAILLILFGIYMVVGAFMDGESAITWTAASISEVFVQGVILTAANPLTVLFWSGVFAGQAAKYHCDAAGLWRFAGGCVTSTICFLSMVSVVGAFAGMAMNEMVLMGLNVVVGIAIAYSGIQLVWKGQKNGQGPFFIVIISMG